MGSIKKNKGKWETYDWSQRGDEWSFMWGGVDLQWYATILPRIHHFLPAKTILEIAPGGGRWTQYLKDLCEKLLVVDLSEKCIEICKERFHSCSHISYHVNDGKSLEMVPDQSIDFAFSFDSLVHADADVLEAYLNQLAHKLTRNGVAFIHHSNLEEYIVYFQLIEKLPRGKRFLAKMGLIDHHHGRAFDLTAEKFEMYCHKAGLACISQELVNWSGGRDDLLNTTRRLIDGLSICTPKGSVWERPNRVVRNKYFIDQAKYLLKLSELYTF